LHESHSNKHSETTHFRTFRSKQSLDKRLESLLKATEDDENDESVMLAYDDDQDDEEQYESRKGKRDRECCNCGTESRDYTERGKSHKAHI
jgi:hypothetical protein